MLKLAGVPVAPVTWHKDGRPYFFRLSLADVASLYDTAAKVFEGIERANDGAEQTGQVAAMTAKNVRRQAELARTERIIRQRRDISA